MFLCVCVCVFFSIFKVHAANLVHCDVKYLGRKNRLVFQVEASVILLMVSEIRPASPEMCKTL